VVAISSEQFLGPETEKSAFQLNRYLFSVHIFCVRIRLLDVGHLDR
jgi:hypothetical protein